jgi:hypothetical protein
MDHGERGAARLAWRLVDNVPPTPDPESKLEWDGSKAWTYSLGAFGTMQSLNGSAPWVVRIRGRPAGVYRSLDAARRALERAAREAGHEIEP